MSSELSIDDRAEIFRALLGIMNDWHVNPRAQIVLLGLPEDTKPRGLHRYRMGHALPDEKDFVTRAELIITINNAINTLYPHNPDAANYWVTTENFYFGDKTPLQVMLEKGAEGMKSVLDHLNGVY